MLQLTCAHLELRGIVNKTSAQSGNVYYIVHLENADGEPHKFFCKKAEAFPAGLKKGDIVTVTFNYYVYEDTPQLTIAKIVKE